MRRWAWVVMTGLAFGVACGQEAVLDEPLGSGTWNLPNDYVGRKGSATSPASVQAALGWLAARADPNEGWGTTDATSLATLACLATGDTDKVGQARKVAWSGLRTLAHVHSARGDGRFDDDDASHLLATFAVTDAFALSGRRVLRASSEEGLDVLVRILRELPERDASGDDARSHPLMLAGLGLQALHAAERTLFNVYPSRAFEPAVVIDTIAWIDATLDTDHGAPRAAVAAALLGAILHERTRERIANSVLLLESRGGLVYDGDVLWAMHAASVLRQLEPIDAGAWAAWRDALTSALVSTQVADGDARGTWDPRGDDLDRVATTAAHAIALLAPTRYAAITDIDR